MSTGSCDLLQRAIGLQRRLRCKLFMLKVGSECAYVAKGKDSASARHHAAVDGRSTAFDERAQLGGNFVPYIVVRWQIMGELYIMVFTETAGHDVGPSWSLLHCIKR